MSLTVLVVDDDEDIRRLLALTLSRDPRVTVVGAVGDGEAAVEFVRYERPEVVLMDLLMPRLDGLETTRRIKQEWPRTKVIVLTALTEEAYRLAAYNSGADGFLNKREIATELLPAIREMAEETAERSAELHPQIVRGRLPPLPSAGAHGDAARQSAAP
jgi:DNA-binding NarL/FixJ family response regulator